MCKLRMWVSQQWRRKFFSLADGTMHSEAAGNTASLRSSSVYAGVKLDEDSLARLRVGQLKDLLTDRGLTCRSCVERSDYLQFVRDHLKEPDL